MWRKCSSDGQEHGLGPAHVVGGKDSCKACRGIPTVTCGSRWFSIQVMLFPCLYHFNRWVSAWDSHPPPPPEKLMLLRRMDTELFVKQRSQQSWQGGTFLIYEFLPRFWGLGTFRFFFILFCYFFKELEHLHTCRTEALRKMSCRILQVVSKRSSLYPLFWYLLFSNCLVGVNY